MDWDAALYLKFNDERTRAARDLLAQIPLTKPRRIVELGCGPGNSTALLAARFPQAEVVGVDSSPEMIARARAALPGCRFQEADVRSWRPEPGVDLIFANALFQWIPDHAGHLRSHLEALDEGGVLAVQMPDNLEEPSHALMHEVASDDRWRRKMDGALQARDALLPLEAYYDLLKPVAARVEVWRTVYVHALADAEAVVAWVSSTGLRPFLAALTPEETPAFLEIYKAQIRRAYQPAVDGRVLFRFPRVFIVARR
jgi:trans-aconitate 2-methyltransferase